MPAESRILSFDVAGAPVAKGSMKAFARRGGGAPIVTHDSARTKPWQEAVAWGARVAAANAGLREPWEGAVTVEARFRLTRPKGHYRRANPRQGELAPRLLPSAPIDHTVKPDGDKLARLVGDAMTGIVYRDDALVVMLLATKRYCAAGEAPGVTVTVRW